MDFRKFQNIFLGFGIGELEFHILSSREDAFIGIDVDKNENFVFCLSYKGKTYQYNTEFELLDAKVFDGKTLEEIWYDVSVDCIDGCNEEEFLEHLDSDYYLSEYIAQFRVGAKPDVTRLIARLLQEEYWGRLILYAGTRELSDFDVDDETYRYYFYIPRSNRAFLLEKENRELSLSQMDFYRMKNKVKNCYGKAGRKFDRFSVAHARNKSDTYRWVLQYEKEINKRLPQIVKTIVGVLSFILFAALIGNDRQWMIGMGQFVVVLGSLIAFSVIKAKKTDRLRDKALPPIQYKEATYSPMFLEILKESELGFDSLYEGVYGVDSSTKKYGGFLEYNSIDLVFQNKKHEIHISFYNKCVLITVDEESVDKKYKLSYNSYENYEKLEEAIYRLIIGVL